MSDQYRIERKEHGFDNIIPSVEYVVDKKTNERVGEVTHMQNEDAGKKIEDGDWKQYPADGSE
jgi:hypothetical protein